MTASEQIIEVLNYICEKVGLAIDWTVVFANENVIPYIELLCGKFVTYEIATSVVWMVLGIILLILAILYIYFYVKKKWHDKLYDECMTIGFAIGIIMAAIAIIGVQTFDIVTCVTFPEKVIIEEVMEIYEDIK